MNAGEARRSNRKRWLARRIQDEFEGLETEQAANLASEAFPVVVDEQAGGSPRLPVGESVTGYPTDKRRIEFPGYTWVVESLAPIAVETSSGQRVPVDSWLSDVGGAFEPKTPVAGVRVPKKLGEGVSVPGVGVR